MNDAFYIGAVGLQSQQRALEVTANNIANLNTPGFKRAEARFSQVMAAAGPQPAATEAMGGVMAQVSPPVFTQGEIQTTGKPMDVAIDGDGFLELAGPDGRTLLWRGGTLAVGADGFLTAAATGLPLKAMVSVPREATAIVISRDGEVRAVMGENGRTEEIGRIEVVRVRDGAAVPAMTGGFYEPATESDVTAMRPGEEGAGVLVQGAIEGSNVAMAEEMVTLMLLQRAYAASAQVIQAGDQLMAIANGLRR